MAVRVFVKSVFDFVKKTHVTSSPSNIPSCCSILIQVQMQDLGNALLLHGHAVEHVGRLHGTAAVGDDDKLRFVR